jgi:hypothetical protein
MNVSGSGASLSLGGPGATLNFSSRGARATFGVPGTGLSFSESLFRPQARQQRGVTQTVRVESAQQFRDALHDPRATIVYAKSQRRLSASQLAAAHRELARREQHAEAQREVARIEADEKAVLDSWREASEVVSAQEHASALHPRAFVNTEAAPHACDLAGAETILRERALENAQLSMPRSTSSRSAGLLAGVVVAAAGAAAAGTNVVVMLAAIVAGVVLGYVVDRLNRNAWMRETGNVAQKTGDADWPIERARLEQQHAEALAARAEREVMARTEWDDSERARVAWATALAHGDLPTIEETIFESLDELDFPFEANCVAAAEDAQHVFVGLDLPEIEDVIPETRFNVLKNGSLREVKRKAEDRNGAYAGLVCGVVLSVAATVFSAAPTVRAVTITAFTQRKRRGAASIEDAFVIETRIERQGFEALNVKASQPAETLGRFQTRWEWGANLVLKKIAPPPWMADLQTPGS